MTKPAPQYFEWHWYKWKPNRTVLIPSHQQRIPQWVLCVPRFVSYLPCSVPIPIVASVTTSATTVIVQTGLIPHTHHSHSPLSGSSSSASVLWLSCLLGSQGGTSKISSWVRSLLGFTNDFNMLKGPLSWFSCGLTGCRSFGALLFPPLLPIL